MDLWHHLDSLLRHNWQYLWFWKTFFAPFPPTCPPIFLPVHNSFYPSKWRVWEKRFVLDVNRKTTGTGILELQYRVWVTCNEWLWTCNGLDENMFYGWWTALCSTTEVSHYAAAFFLRIITTILKYTFQI